MALIGHTTLQQELRHLAGLEDMPQSFLFSGPRHVGKRSMAVWFAEKLIDSSQQGNFEQNLLIVEPQEVATAKRVREQLISIDSIREAQKFLTLSPTAGKRRVLIIDGAEKLGASSANALLKLLEEPPAKSSIILVTSEPGSLLPTLLSRLVAFHFRPVDGELLRKSIQGAAALPQFFVDLGLPGLVIEAVSAQAQFDEKKDILRRLFQLSKLSLHERMHLAEILSQDERAARDVLEIWCVGLVFQIRNKVSGLASHYSFLEQVLRTLQCLSRGEGAPRSLLEKLFFSL